MEFFNNNLGIHALIVYFYCMLIDSINNYKNHKKDLFSQYSFMIINSVCVGFV